MLKMSDSGKVNLGSVVSDILAEAQNSYCRLCLCEMANEFLHLEDAVCIDTESAIFKPLEEVLSEVLGAQVSCDVTGLDTICVLCTEMALNSYKFISKFHENNKLLENVFNNLAETLSTNINKVTTDQTLYIILNNNETRLVIMNKKPKKYKKNKYVSKKLYVCEICGDKLNTLGDLKDHAILNHSCLVCEKCLVTFLNNEDLETHMSINHKFKCSKCSQVRTSKESLQEHHDKAHGLYVCKDCGKSYEGIEKLKVHEEAHNKKTCPKCGKRYNTKDFFLKHKELCLQGLLQPHAPRPKLKFPFTCEQCGKGYSTKGGLRVHNRFVHGDAKPHICEWCNKGFTAPSYLKTHTIKHTGEKNFDCKICNGKFVSKEALLYHTRRHTGEKPYNCTHCPEKFVNASARAEHIKFKHIGPTLMCDICSRKFVTPFFLKKHISRHHDPCSKLYNRWSVLNESNQDNID